MNFRHLDFREWKSVYFVKVIHIQWLANWVSALNYGLMDQVDDLVLVSTPVATGGMTPAFVL